MDCERPQPQAQSQQRLYTTRVFSSYQSPWEKASRRTEEPHQIVCASLPAFVCSIFSPFHFHWGHQLFSLSKVFHFFSLTGKPSLNPKFTPLGFEGKA